MKALALIPALLAVLATPSSAVATAKAEGVSKLSYAPRPMYDDHSQLRVRFTTTGRVAPGREYYVFLSIVGPDAASGGFPACVWHADSTFRSNTTRPVRIFGAPGQTYAVVLRAPDDGIVNTGYFCPGRATLTVGTNLIRKPTGAANRRLRTITFRVQRAP